MFKLLFNRSAPLVRLLELLGLWNSFRLLKGDYLTPPLLALYLLFLFLYIFVRLCDLTPWHLSEQKSFWDRTTGIRVHFRKALVPISYSLIIASSVLFLGIPLLSWTILILAHLCAVILAASNAILIVFYFSDKEQLPINYFSHNKYLKENGDDRNQKQKLGPLDLSEPA